MNEDIRKMNELFAFKVIELVEKVAWALEPLFPNVETSLEGGIVLFKWDDDDDRIVFDIDKFKIKRVYTEGFNVGYVKIINRFPVAVSLNDNYKQKLFEYLTELSYSWKSYRHCWSVIKRLDEIISLIEAEGHRRREESKRIAAKEEDYRKELLSMFSIYKVKHNVK